MSATWRATTRTSVVWVAVTLGVAAVVPGGGFIVAAASRLPRFRAASPSLALLLVIASAVMLVQLAGMTAWAGVTTELGPPERVAVS